ncbi:hypothetical protein [Tahibacter sp.]|uniref:hypothetical protein n=1 Tax=Tahibacter sp. TaxID=2056211 RepID=UPI0028C37B6C|nr:hypothetical protein [Tahibacter sp.]
MRVAVAFAVLSAAIAAPAAAPVDDSEFRTEAVAILLEKALSEIEDTHFVCVSVENAPLLPNTLSRYAADHGRNLGGPAECVCVEKGDRQVCTRKGFPAVRACWLTMFDFRITSDREAFLTYLVSCGWPEGGGEAVRFEKKEGRWIYAEAVGRIVL